LPKTAKPPGFGGGVWRFFGGGWWIGEKEKDVEKQKTPPLGGVLRIPFDLPAMLKHSFCRRGRINQGLHI